MQYKLYTSILLITTALSCNSFGQELYKYKDKSGRWVFSDKRPEGAQQTESLRHIKPKETQQRPRVYVQERDNRHYLIADNPYHAPVEFRVVTSAFETGSKTYIVPGAKQEILYENSAVMPPYRYAWQLGDPASMETNYLYSSPTPSKMLYEITQSFNGAFSHTDIQNNYAVDISMPVGTDISAARNGIVIWTKDDYHMSGRTEYFLNKANYVSILHEDGTYATYAHLLMGSIKVKPGDNVKAGDTLARSGSSGYSTGPHLHFVIRKNTGLKAVSIPFNFTDRNGIAFVPREGMKIEGGISP